MSSTPPNPKGLPRATWSRLTEEQLLAQCEVDTYRASGPGGQKRNKTSSAVRLRHLPTGLIVIAEESRSQHENKAKALKRLCAGLFLHLRRCHTSRELHSGGGRGSSRLCHSAQRGRPAPSLSRDPRFWPAVGVVLDVLTACETRVADAAALLGISTGNLIDFLQTDPKVWQEANRLRTLFGQKPLR